MFDEIAKLLNVEEATTSTKGWFEKRLPAIHNVLENMSAEESAEIDVEVDRISNGGYPDEVRRQYVDIGLGTSTGG